MEKQLISFIKHLIDEKEAMIDNFRKIRMDLTTKNYTTAKMNINQDKNNFTDVLSSEETRVILSPNEYGSDYINANWIFNKYIATQHPYNTSTMNTMNTMNTTNTMNTLNTVNDFWKMIYDTNTTMILNLDGSTDYIPNVGETIGYGAITVSIEKQHTNKNLVIRYIKLKHSEMGNRFVLHITYHNWPDKQIPTEIEFINLLNFINMLDTETKAQIVVHCQAGIGRTGTFICIYEVIQRLTKGEIPDILDIIRKMRTARIGMVQNKCQLQFALLMILHSAKEYLNKLSSEKKVKKKNKLAMSCGDEHLMPTPLEKKVKNKLTMSCGESYMYISKEDHEVNQFSLYSPLSEA